MDYSNYLFIEDTDLETGHGYLNHCFWAKPSDSNYSYRIRIWSEEDQEWKCIGTRYLGYSYAWIVRRDFWEKHHHIQDKHLSLPNLDGGQDMESHFEFRMSPAEMRAYLRALGMEQVHK